MDEPTIRSLFEELSSLDLLIDDPALWDRKMTELLGKLGDVQTIVRDRFLDSADYAADEPD